MGKIFVNYRRDDSAPYALNVAQYLERTFGSRNVFIDIDRMRAGQKFPQVLEERLGQCDVMVTVIGPNWLEVRADDGSRRLDDPEDWVRMEIERALERGVVVIPTTVGGASLPSKRELPEPLQPLVDHHAVNVTRDGFRGEMMALTQDIRSIRTNGSGGVSWRLTAALLFALAIVGAAGYFGYLAPPPSSTAPKQANIPENEDMIKEAQILLLDLGYDPGEADGKRGVKTANAIKAFQKDKGIKGDNNFGAIDQQFLSVLRTAKRTKLLEQQAEQERVQAEKKAKDEAQRKATAEAERKAREEALQKERTEARRNSREPVQRYSDDWFTKSQVCDGASYYACIDNDPPCRWSNSKCIDMRPTEDIIAENVRFIACKHLPYLACIRNAKCLWNTMPGLCVSRKN